MSEVIDPKDFDSDIDIDIEERVFALVERSSGIKTKRLREDPSYVLNRTIDGDDASELMKAFEREFDVDMQNYAHDRYFGYEGIRDPLSVILGWLKASSNTKYSPLTALDLINAAKSRRWP